MNTKTKNPTVAAILNFLIPGIGYLYAQKREHFGWMILSSTIILGVYSLNKPDLMRDGVFMIATAILSLAFAYDVYFEMTQSKKIKK